MVIKAPAVPLTPRPVNVATPVPETTVAVAVVPPPINVAPLIVAVITGVLPVTVLPPES